MKGARRAVRSHTLCIRGLNLMLDGFVIEVQEIDNLEPQEVEIKLLKHMVFTVEAQENLDVYVGMTKELVKEVQGLKES